jgi:hypothetical protein
MYGDQPLRHSFVNIEANFTFDGAKTGELNNHHYSFTCFVLFSVNS